MDDRIIKITRNMDLSMHDLRDVINSAVNIIMQDSQSERLHDDVIAKFVRAAQLVNRSYSRNSR